jgi:hypothetical protein
LSSEAKYAAISEPGKEIKFIYFSLQGIRTEIELPIIVKTDNIGATFMAQNSSSGVRTRDVDTSITTSVILLNNTVTERFGI